MHESSLKMEMQNLITFFLFQYIANALIIIQCPTCAWSPQTFKAFREHSWWSSYRSCRNLTGLWTHSYPWTLLSRGVNYGFNYKKTETFEKESKNIYKTLKEVIVITEFNLIKRILGKNSWRRCRCAKIKNQIRRLSVPGL